MLKHRFFLSLLAIMCSIAAWAQQEVRGVVSSNQDPLPGVNIKIEGSNVSTVTDENGRYGISVPSSQAVLVFSSVGYVSQQIVVGQRRNIDITLEEDMSAIDEVVVVGYGTQKRINLTGAVSSIDGEELAKRPVHRASMALQGMAPGVAVTQSSGRPGGDGGTIRVRGIGTFSDAGASPLVLIDGVESSIDGVDPNDIQNISVLKDAASAAIYGSRAANGVILVTTKTGGGEQLQMNYNGYVGRQVFTELPEFVDGYTYMTKLNEAFANVNRTPIYSDEFLEDYLRYKDIDPDWYPDTDWQKEAYTGSGMTQHHHVGVSGGKLVNFMGSIAYQDQQGVIPNHRQQRYSFRLNAKANVKDNLQTTFLVSGRLSPTERSARDIYTEVNRISPVQPARLTDGRWGVGSNGNNPIAHLAEGGINQYDYDQLRATFQINYQPFKGADLEAFFTPEYSGNHRRHFNKAIETFVPGMETPAYTVPVKSLFIRSNARTWENTARLIGRYNKQLNDHSFSGLVGYEQIGYRTEDFSARREGYQLPDYQELDAGPIENWQNSGTRSEWSLRSWFGRINYDYKGRYLLEANIRVDGSSRFPDRNKYGTFPSFSAGWRIADEDFMAPTSSWLSDLKLRASWGRLGNQQIGNYPFSAVMALGSSYIFGNSPVQGANQQEMANLGISWETTETTNLGLDMAVFNNRLSASFDYYVKNTTGILMRLPVPAIIGLTEPYQNAGVVRNKGWDLTLRYRSAPKDFRYDIGLNVSDVQNEVVDLRGTGPIISGFRVIEEGMPINTLFGYNALGLFRDQQQVDEYPRQSFTNYGPGDIIYEDVNGDGVVNTEDRVAIGNEIPRYIFGLNLNAQYKGFDFSALIQGVGERNSIFTGDAIWAMYNNGKMQKWHLDHWTPENLDAAYPRLISESTHNNFMNSSWWVYSGAYARLKNVQIGYTFPERWVGNGTIKKLRVYTTGDNIFTLHKMPKGWDPETRSGDANIYPISSTFLFGVNLTF
ncbi:SusC/RagA family TonB-linked outer membrane protein [Sphingobacterium chuzhouense]|uniref:TonB-dependent receptor n=1 Tax=Sphingobacterium chuzhouense TaxID=1742264 RepID=A0ABR7XWJ0_9SPHI|nr:TonB-dependent receptor [Sphingobacterium chuzhouense]MBD1423388.1 TonB-dependent receptor [Sphingobacterium chuzhouense]